MKMPERDIVSMTREVWCDTVEYIHQLEKAQEFLECLRAAGVADWEGYADAQYMMYEGRTHGEE